jgi:hypothetical protein
VYRDPSFPVELRVDAAAKAARFERPALAATLTRDVTAPRDPAARNARILELLERGDSARQTKLSCSPSYRRQRTNRLRCPLIIRPSIEQLIEQARQHSAARSSDPERWLAADGMHQAAVDRHREKLRAERNAPPPAEDIAGWMQAHSEVLDEAVALAVAEGFLSADEVVKRCAGEPQEEARLSAPGAVPSCRPAARCTRRRGVYRGAS